MYHIFNWQERNRGEFMSANKRVNHGACIVIKMIPKFHCYFEIADTVDFISWTWMIERVKTQGIILRDIKKCADTYQKDLKIKKKKWISRYVKMTYIRSEWRLSYMWDHSYNRSIRRGNIYLAVVRWNCQVKKCIGPKDLPGNEPLHQYCCV